MPTLLELSDEIICLERELEAAEDIETREILITQYFSAVGDRNQKIDAYAGLIRELELRAEVRKSEAERMQNRSRIDMNKAQFLKDRLLMVFKTFNISIVEGSRFKISKNLNGGKLPVIISCPIECLPENYLKQIITIKPNLELIAEDLEAGVIIDGVCWGERGESIRIK